MNNSKKSSHINYTNHIIIIYTPANSYYDMRLANYMSYSILVLPKGYTAVIGNRATAVIFDTSISD